MWGIMFLTKNVNKSTTITYRYGGAGGQETESEITGSPTHYSAEYWMYDSRLIRRWNLDPKPQVFISDYACFANNPIFLVDPDGAKVKVVGKDTRKEIRWEKRNVEGFRAQYRTEKRDKNNLYIYKLDKYTTKEGTGARFQISVASGNNHTGASRAFQDDPTNARLSGNNRQGLPRYNGVNNIQMVFSSRNHNTFSHTDPAKMPMGELKGEWQASMDFNIKIPQAGQFNLDVKLLSGYEISFFIDGQQFGNTISNPQEINHPGQPHHEAHNRQSFNMTVNYSLVNSRTNNKSMVSIMLRTTNEGGQVHHEGYLHPWNIAKGKFFLD